MSGLSVVLAGGDVLAGSVLLAGGVPEDHEVTPGLTGFFVTFALALAVIGLMLLFVRDLRKVNRSFAKRNGTSATSSVLSNDRQVEASLGSSWPYPDAEAAQAADRATGVQGVAVADEVAVARERADDGASPPRGTPAT